MNQLGVHIESYLGLPKNEAELFASYFKPVTLQKGDYFLKANQYCKQLAFVQSGSLREFLYVNDKEVTKWISNKGYFAVDLSSFLFNQPSSVNWQAIDTTELFVISKTDFDKIETIVPNWQEVKTILIAKCFAILENRVISHLAMSAEERYNQFFELNPKLFNEVPLQYIASILGMTPETLSRIRKRI